VQVDPAALELELVVILGRAVRRCREQRCCFKDGVCDVAGWRPRRSAARPANRKPTATHDADVGWVMGDELRS
jgi:hypothetical protein